MLPRMIRNLRAGSFFHRLEQGWKRIAANALCQPRLPLQKQQLCGCAALFLLCVSLPALAEQTPASTAHWFPNSVSPQSRLGKAANASGARSSAKSRVPHNSAVKTPFERVLGPHLPEVFGSASRNAPQRASGNAGLRGKATADGVDGSKVNFPGFVAAPFLTINNGDATPAYASVAGDFNNDGYPDVASVQSDGTVNVVLNPGSKGDWSQAKQVTPNTSLNAVYPLLDIFWAETIDLNGDGILDLVGADYLNTQLVIWIGNGDGTFSQAKTYLVRPSSGALWFAGGGGFFVVGDFNGDGTPDVATVALSSGLFQTVVTEQTFLNDGKGNLTPGTETNSTLHDYYLSTFGGQASLVTDGSKVTGIAFLLADLGFNQSANSGIDLLVLGSNGDGTFAAAVEPTGPIVADNPYLKLSSTKLQATNLKSKSASPLVAGSVRELQRHASGNTGVATTDFVFMTGDGAVYDAPYTAQSGSLALSSANTLVGANFENLSKYHHDPLVRRPNSAAGSQVAAPIEFLNAITVADANGDGLSDLFAYSSGAVYIYLNGGNGTFSTAPAQVISGFSAWQQPQPQDFDGSGHTSFVAYDSQLNQLGYYQGDGTGHFFGAAAVAGSSDRNDYALSDNISVQATGDFNGDGLQDVIALDWSNSGTAANNGYPDIVVGINNGKKSLANEVNNFAFSKILSAADFASIGGAYVEPFVVQNAVGGQTIFLSATGGIYYITATKGVFSAPNILLPAGTFKCPFNLADVGDVDGDGIPDVVATYGGNASCGGTGMPSGFFTFFGQSDGNYHTGGFMAVGSSLYQARLIDFNGDGSPDLALIDQDSSNFVYNVYVLPNKADGSGGFDISKMVNPVSGYIVADIIPGDYNSDGKQDLTLATLGQYNPNYPGLTLFTNTWGVQLLPGNGDFTFGTPTTVDTGYFPAWGSYADFNGDGTPDLALAVYGDNTTVEDISGRWLQRPPLVQILPNLGGGAFGQPIGEFDGFYYDLQAWSNAPSYSYAPYTFTGNFGGGSDLLVSGFYNTAEFLNQGTDTLALVSSATSANQGQSVTLTATLTQPVSNPQTPTGAILFYDNGQLIGAQDISSAGVASLITAELPTGKNAIKAVFAGDSHYNAVTAIIAVAITALSPDFTLAATSGSLSLQQGATGMVTLSVAANTTFSGNITFSCSGAPSETSCVVSPGSLAVSAGQTGVATIVVSTTSKNSKVQAKNEAPWMNAAGGVTFAGLLFCAVPRRRRLMGVFSLILLATLVSGSMVMTGCAGSSSGAAGTPVGNSTLTVTASAGGVIHTQTVTLQITKP